MATYVFTDLHGNAILWGNILKFIKPEDRLICLGDICDCGEAGFELFQEIYEHPQVMYCLRGNHEDMLQRALNEDFRGVPMIYNESYDLLSWNGGAHTFKIFNEMDNKNKKKWYHILNNLPYTFTYENIRGNIVLLSHAGANPWEVDFDVPHTFDKHDLIWGREHFSSFWSADKTYDNVYVIHGHTPNSYIYQENPDLEIDSWEKNQPLFYANKHKIGLDNYAIKTHKIILFNLDDFTFKIIKEKM